MDADDLMRLGRAIRDTRYAILITYVAMAWDHMLTFAEEVCLVWNKPKNLISYLFLINRYMSHFVILLNIYDKLGETSLDDNFCRTWIWVDGVLQSLGYGLTYTLVALRVCALWERKKVVVRFVAVVWSLQGAATLTVAVVGMYYIEVLDYAYRDPNFNICTVQRVTPWLFWVWVPSLITESILFSLTALRCILDYQSHATLPLAKVVYFDGLLYYFVLILTMAYNIIAWTALDREYCLIAKYSSQAIATMMGSKIVLNLKNAGNRRPGVPIGQSAAYELEEMGPETRATAMFKQPAAPRNGLSQVGFHPEESTFDCKTDLGTCFEKSTVDNTLAEEEAGHPVEP